MIHQPKLTALLVAIGIAFSAPNSLAQPVVRPISAAETTQESAPLAAAEQYPLVGELTMQWLWFDLYEAQLSTPSVQYTTKKWPLALNETSAVRS